jgi:hypothetical protein
VTTYVGICGPHFGVPEVLEYALGLSDWLSITAGDMQTFSRNHSYPGCYQLLPYQGYDVQYDVLNDVNSGAEDFYQATNAADFALDPTNLGAATALQQLLTFQNKPSGVNYALVAAYGHPTDQTINYDGQTFVNILSNAPGDGTVPLWSAAPPQFNNTLITPGDHFSVMSTYAFRDFLWKLLTGKSAPFLLLEIAGVTLSLDRLVYAPGDPISLLTIPDRPAGQIAGTLRIEKAAGRSFKRYQSQFIRGELTAPAEPGIYRITLSGKTHATVPQIAAQFAVSETTDRRVRRRDRR